MDIQKVKKELKQLKVWYDSAATVNDSKRCDQLADEMHDLVTGVVDQTIEYVNINWNRAYAMDQYCAMLDKAMTALLRD